MKKLLRIILITFGVIIGAFLVMAIIGAIFWPPESRTDKPEEVTAPVKEETPEPEETAATVIPGLSPVDVYLSLEGRGFTIEKDFGPDYATYDCKQAWPSVTFSAQVTGPSVDEVSRVRADVMADAVNKTRLAGRDFIAYVASLPYEGSQPQEAHDWVVANFETEGVSETTIGTVHFRMNSPTVAYTMLSIEPVR